MSKKLAEIAMIIGAIDATLGNTSPYSYGYFNSSKRKGSSQKYYKNKNTNIEYYTDEKVIFAKEN